MSITTEEAKLVKWVKLWVKLLAYFLLQGDLLYNIPEIVGIMVWNECASASYPESFIILVTVGQFCSQCPHHKTA